MMRESKSRIRPGIRRLLGLEIPPKDTLATELEDEMKLHLDLRAEQLRRQGMSDDAAMLQARARYGPVDEVTKEIRKHAGRREQQLQRRITFDALSQDIRFAFRTLGRSKAWTTVAVVTLALGIGANTAVFSVVNDLLLDPLRYPEPDRLVFASRMNEQSKLSMDPTLPQLRAWRAAKSFDGIEGIGGEKLTLEATDGDPSSVHVGMVTSTFARFAGARVLRGRFIISDDEKAGAAGVALLSDHTWRGRFGADPNAVGRTIKIEGKPHTIIGVIEDGVRTPSYLKEPVDIWVPLPQRGFLGGPVVGRLAKNVTIEQAQQELRNISAGMEIPENNIAGAKFTVALRTPGSSGESRRSLLMIAGAVCLLLLIACANVAHLLLARGATRERELAVRAALGAGRGRIVRQLLTETLILSIAGCALGLAVGAIALRAIIALRPASMGELANARIDLRVLLATLAISLVSGIAFGLIAGLSGRGGNNFDVLRSSVAGTADRVRARLRSLLVVTENALSVVLLIGAVLLIRTVANLYHIDPGFDATGVYAMTVNLPETRYNTAAARQAYGDRLIAEARRLPGVEQATIASNPPSRTGVMIGNWIAEGGHTASSNGAPAFTAMNTVQAQYFGMIRMRLESGRTFNESSTSNQEVIVSRAMAKQLWGETNVVGRRLRMDGTPTDGSPIVWNVVAGVAPNAALLSLTDLGETPGIYFPLGAVPDQHMTLIVRMRPGMPAAGNFRQLFLSLDRSMSPPEIINVPELLLRSVASQRFLMALLSLFAVLAVTLSAIGLYGVITYMVNQSTREIGVRVALGAARRDVVRLVMRKGVTLSFAGLVLGLVASIWGAKAMAHMLFGITAMDPVSYIVGSAVLMMIAIGACIAPTRRALRIDPMLAMRSE